MNIEELSNDLSGRLLETKAFVTASTYSGIIDWTLHQLKAKGLLMVWRDISSAPRDGTPIIARNKDVWQWCASWNDVTGCWGENFKLTKTQPTHWMPLPKETK